MDNTAREDHNHDPVIDDRSAQADLSWDAVHDDLITALGSVRDLLDSEFISLFVPVDNDHEFVAIASFGVPSDTGARFHLTRDDEIVSRLRADSQPIIVEDPASAPHISPLCAIPGIGSVTIVPATHDKRLLGLLHLGSRSQMPDYHQDSRLLELATLSIAMAIDCAATRQAELRISDENRIHRERLSFLAVASGMLASSLDYETTLSQITSMLIPRLADVCAVVLTDGDGSVNQVTVDAVDPALTRLVREVQDRYSLRQGAHSAVRRVLDTGTTEFHPELSETYFAETASDAEHLQLLRDLGMRSMVIVPLNGRAGTIGALSVAFTGDARRYTPDEVEFIEELAQLAGMAVENARLFEDSQRSLRAHEDSLRFREQALKLEREARERAEASERREALLSDASSILSASFDYTSTLENLARLIVSRIADWCTVELLDDNGTSSLVAAAHVDPHGDSILERIRREYVPATIPELPPRHLLRYREPTLIRSVPEEFWFDSAATPEHLLLLDQLGTTGLIVLPLFARGRTLGIMTLGRTDISESFDEDDVPVTVDLGYRVALAIDNARLYNRAQSVVQQREEFISTASHELKTPLTTVKGYLQLINRQLHREDFSPERIVRFTRELDDQVRRLEYLVSDLLDVSRIQQGRLDLRLEQFDLAELAGIVLNRFELAPENLSSHELTLSAPEAIVGTWDRERIDQVLTNLISNALKYSPDGGQVLVRVGRTNDLAQITVRDHGIGIRPEEKTSLFQPFARGRHIKPRISGTGLGLYITQRIVQNHRGSIFVRSDPGQGTSFIVQLPMQLDSLNE